MLEMTFKSFSAISKRNHATYESTVSITKTRFSFRKIKGQRQDKKLLLFFFLKYLEHRQAGLGECVKMTSGLDCIGELATEDLHPQQGENENEQEQDYE